MKYEKCSEGEVEQYLRFLEKRFGIPRNIFRKLSFFKRGKNIWIFSGDPALLNHVINVEAAGIRFLTITKKFMKPSTTFLQIFGKYASKNVVELRDEEELIEFMTGGLIKREFDAEKGFVIVKFRDNVLGCGLYSEIGLLSQIPKSKRIDKRWLEK